MSAVIGAGRVFDSADVLVDSIVGRLGRRIVLGLPVGIGKANRVANALYHRARTDRTLDLTIFTGLTLSPPAPTSGFAQRLAGPIVDRLYADWPALDFETDRVRGTLPENVRVREFYLRPGAYLGNAAVQQAYTSINYSRVAAELLRLGVNLVAQLVAPHPNGEPTVSLGSNPEVTLDLMPALEGRPHLLVGEVNPNLPYMPGAAEMAASAFDGLLDAAETRYPLFALPNRAVGHADYAAGMHVASLVPDGGTLQVGIGSMSDAVAHCLRLRHENNTLFRDVLRRLPGGTASPHRGELPIEDRPFSQGLYSCTELLSDAVFSLFRAGIVRRPADDRDDAVIHAGFFIGSPALYDGLRALAPAQRRRIAMSPISWVNTLYGDEQRKRRQRRDARFVNETMMVTLLGAAVSDALDDGRVVSGIGGQFDFVDMAGALPSSHSILMLHSWRRHGGRARSNIRWSYAHNSVPRQHRDLFVTEYGVAATRGRPDSEVIESLLRIADARFQDSLAASACDAGKLRASFRAESAPGQNRPDAIERVFRDPAIAAHFPAYPLGSVLSQEEQALAAALQWLKETSATTSGKWRILRGAAGRGGGQERRAAELQRMGLASPDGLRERWLRRVLRFALDETGR